MTRSPSPSFVAELEAAAAQLAALPPSRLHALDEVTRSRTCTPPFALSWDWMSVEPRAAIEAAARTARPGAALALLAMHASGYVREAAVRALDRSDDALALPLLLLRTADWVAQVRSPAVAAIERRRAHGPLEPWLALLALIETLASKVARDRKFAGGVRDWLVAAAPPEPLIELLRSTDRPLRRAAARALVSKDASRDALARGLAAALEQDDATTARLLAAALARCESATAEDLEALWSSRFSFVRALALPRILERGGESAEAASLAGLRDGSGLVRATARSWLQGRGRDLAALHDEMLESDPVAALRGLVEIGAIRETGRVVPLLSHRRPRVRAMAVKTLGFLAGRAAEERLVEFLDDESSRVAKSAARTLAPLFPGRASLERAWQIAERHVHAGALPASFLLFQFAGRFTRLRMAARALVSTDAALPEFGKRTLQACLDAWNREATAPVPADVEELRSLVPTLCARLPPATARLLEFTLRPFLAPGPAIPGEPPPPL